MTRDKNTFILPFSPPIFHLLYVDYGPCFIKHHQTNVRHLWSLVRILRGITWGGGMKCLSEHNRFVHSSCVVNDC